MHPEPVDLRFVAALGLWRQEAGVHLEEDVMERGAEVGAIDDGVAGGFWIVEVLAARAVELDSADVGVVVLAHGEQILTFAGKARAFAEVALLEFVEL